MTYMMPAQASAQLLSLIVLATAARWYLVPWLKSRTRADALIALLWVHVFRYVALQVFSAQRDGFPISDSGAMEIVIGDVVVCILPVRYSSTALPPVGTISLSPEDKCAPTVAGAALPPARCT